MSGTSPASAWDRPIQLSDSADFPTIDRHGTVRVLQSSRRNRVEVGVLRWGKRRFSRYCAVPGLKQRTEFFQTFWNVTPAGAMAFAWRENVTRAPLKVAAAAQDRCFRRPVVQKAFPRSANLVFLFVAPLGTEIAMWTEGTGSKGRAVLGAAGLGRQLRRTGTVGPPRPGLRFTSSFPSMIGGDRILWTWITSKSSDKSGQRHTETFWAATGGKRGGRLGRARKLAQRTGPVGSSAGFHGMRVFADSAGGQVAGSVPGGYVQLMTRLPGRPFGPLRKFPATTNPGDGFEAAANGLGDVIFAWEGKDDLYALLRRRNGRVIGPRLLTPGSSPRVSTNPSVAVDGAGRAIVAYQAQDVERSQASLTDIRVVIARRGRGFGNPVTISGAERRLFLYPRAAVSPTGRATVTWNRQDQREGELPAMPLLMSRGRLDR